MSKKIYQFVYSNCAIPTGNIIAQHTPVTQLGISAPAGFRFSFDGNEWITIGEYHIYELDLEGGLGQITALYLDSDFDNSKSTVLVDIVYGGVSL